MTAQEFYDARKGLRLTQTGMAEALGINYRSVQRFEHGDWPVSKACADKVSALQAKDSQ